jgi:UPF0755 protein
MKRRALSRNRLAAGAAILIGLGLMTAGLVGGRHTNKRNVEVEITPGMSITEIGRRLDSADVVVHWAVFAMTARLSGKGGRLQCGVYKFPERISVYDVVSSIASGRYQVEFRATIPEGSTVRVIAAILRGKMGIDTGIVCGLARDRRFIRTLGLTTSSLEGYLYPDTYQFRQTDTPEKILTAMARRLQRAVTPALASRMKSTKRTLHEVLTMASLVEGETRIAEERARVAGVYYNRLKKGMPLQADPTIQYIIPDGPRRLYYKDLDMESPYNTYLHSGLPPGPVNNPGLEAIQAALFPESHQYLYFVADGTGGHRFSRNAAEHRMAVAEYRKTQQNDRDQ